MKRLVKDLMEDLGKVVDDTTKARNKILELIQINPREYALCRLFDGLDNRIERAQQEGLLKTVDTNNQIFLRETIQTVKGQLDFGCNALKDRLGKKEKTELSVSDRKDWWNDLDKIESLHLSLSVKKTGRPTTK